MSEDYHIDDDCCVNVVAFRYSSHWLRSPWSFITAYRRGIDERTALLDSTGVNPFLDGTLEELESYSLPFSAVRSHWYVILGSPRIRPPFLTSAKHNERDPTWAGSGGVECVRQRRYSQSFNEPVIVDKCTPHRRESTALTKRGISRSDILGLSRSILRQRSRENSCSEIYTSLLPNEASPFEKASFQ